MHVRAEQVQHARKLEGEELGVGAGAERAVKDKNLGWRHPLAQQRLGPAQVQLLDPVLGQRVALVLSLWEGGVVVVGAFFWELYDGQSL